MSYLHCHRRLSILVPEVHYTVTIHHLCRDQGLSPWLLRSSVLSPGSVYTTLETLFVLLQDTYVVLGTFVVVRVWLTLQSLKSIENPSRFHHELGFLHHNRSSTPFSPSFTDYGTSSTSINKYWYTPNIGFHVCKPHTPYTSSLKLNLFSLLLSVPWYLIWR